MSAAHELFVSIFDSPIASFWKAVRQIAAQFGNWLNFYFMRLTARSRPITPLDGARERTVPARGPRKFRPTGFSPEVDVETHPALATIRKRIALALFDRVGLEWVPGEYWAELRATGEPIVAFTEFCRGLAVDAADIAGNKATEREALRRCVGILLDLARLPEDCRGAVYRQLRDRHYDEADSLVECALAVLHVLAEADKFATRITFAAYRSFVEEVEKYRHNLFGLTLDEAIQARNVHRAFIEYQDVYDHLNEVFDEAEAWTIASWPDDAWGHENLKLRDGILFTSETIRRDLGGRAEIDIEDQLAAFKEAYEHLLGLAKELGRYLGAAHAKHDARRDTSEDKRAMDLASARSILGLPKEGPLTLNQVKSAYRKAAMKYHPDRNPGDPMATARFLEIRIAYNTLMDGITV